MSTRSFPVFLLICTLAMQSGGVLLILKFQQELNRYEMSFFSSLEKERIELMTLSQDEFEACRSGRRELLHDQKLYDIYSWTVSGDSVKILVVNDTDEEHILGHITHFIHSSGKKNTHAPRIIKIVLFNFIQPEFAGLIHFSDLSNFCFQKYSSVMPDSWFDINSPPPELIFNFPAAV